MTLAYFNKIFRFNETTHISALVRQQLDFRIVKWCQTAEKPILLVSRLEGHLGIGALLQELDAHCKSSHVHWILASSDPAIVVANQLARLNNGTAHSGLCDQAHWPHGHLADVAHLNGIGSFFFFFELSLFNYYFVNDFASTYIFHFSTLI